MYVSASYFEPLLSFRVAEFTDSTYIQALMFTVFVLGISTMALSLSCLSKVISLVRINLTGLVLGGIANLFVGPCHLFPNSLIIMGFGLYFSGMATVLCSAPSIIIMLNEAKNVSSEARKASDICSSILVLNHRTGLLIGPMYGGFMNYLVGFRTTCEIVAVILLTYAAIFYTFTREYAEIRDNSEDKQSYDVPDYKSIEGLRKNSESDE